jgi:hypothetical protein
VTHPGEGATGPRLIAPFTPPSRPVPARIVSDDEMDAATGLRGGCSQAASWSIWGGVLDRGVSQVAVVDGGEGARGGGQVQQGAAVQR